MIPRILNISWYNASKTSSSYPALGSYCRFCSAGGACIGSAVCELFRGGRWRFKSKSDMENEGESGREVTGSPGRGRTWGTTISVQENCCGQSKSASHERRSERNVVAKGICAPSSYHSSFPPGVITRQSSCNMCKRINSDVSRDMFRVFVGPTDRKEKVPFSFWDAV